MYSWIEIRWTESRAIIETDSGKAKIDKKKVVFLVSWQVPRAGM